MTRNSQMYGNHKNNEIIGTEILLTHLLDREKDRETYIQRETQIDKEIERQTEREREREVPMANF
jgi:hypothetical protein